uniref:Uncharacterized protein n=1 Tax=Curvibacter symbiont subsp. Hydra magnipapillata TaxID=667019 RepID=C9Y909_CURXX|nr:hypothetical protein Csp_A06100 [Curvibacter putative symbiont of Hydra magnipapillata]
MRKIKEKYFRAPLEVRLQRSIMTVALTPKALKAFTISGPTFVVIGIVRWELEFGLLTIDPNGDYVRVNGSYKELLDSADVRAAIFRASQNWNAPTDSEFHLNVTPPVSDDESLSKEAPSDTAKQKVFIDSLSLVFTSPDASPTKHLLKPSVVGTSEPQIRPLTGTFVFNLTE